MEAPPNFQLDWGQTRAERRLVASNDHGRDVSRLLAEMRTNLNVDLREHGPDVKAFIRTYRSSWRGIDGKLLSDHQRPLKSDSLET
jgi:hypothetical protein